MDEQRKNRTRDLLADYRRKRRAGTTPEPMGEGEAGAGADADPLRPGRFVVQLHAARNRHYDLRLEWGGVLHSWAVPKGPSLDPADKRFAVETEDHPLEYADFEGVIPQGEYGAGAMIVWDRGRFVPHLDPAAGMESGKQLFDLQGHKLRGRWTLVRTKEARQWLLIKKPDGAADGRDCEELPPGSVLSGLTVEEMAAGEDRAAELRRRLEELGAPPWPQPWPPGPGDVQPMLAETADAPFSRPGWLFEIKYDGYRLLAGKGERGPWLAYRSGRDATAVFPELTRALAALPYASLLLDGEVVVLDEEAVPVFQRLQRRALLSRRADVERAAVEDPAVLQTFDLLELDGYDLRRLSLVRRKELLRRVLPAAGPLRYADHVEERGEALFAAVAERGIEGVIGKRADAPYRAGRSPDWLKVRAGGSDDFVVVGFTRTDAGLGALHLALLEDGEMVYAGKVGSGFTERQRRELAAELEELRRDGPAVAGDPPRGEEHAWAEPRLVVEVRYTEVTAGGQLRHPVFVRRRPDKPPGECVRRRLAANDEPPARPSPAPAASPDAPRLHLTNPDKLFWPDAGTTKGDLVAYYDAVAGHLLPYLRDRPVVLDRYPDGIGGKSFFQKNAPEGTPDWVRVESVWSEDGGQTRYVICDDRPTLLWLANLGTIPLHVTASRVSALQHPDWCIFDLDAKDAPFAGAVQVARAIHALCGELEIDSYVKTSGATGLHVLLPLGGALRHQQAHQLAELLARVVVGELPRLASVDRMPEARPGKVYVDYLQNGYGKLLVAPYAVRPLPGAPVSMPLRWDEVDDGLDPRAFTLRTAPERVAAWDGDPLRPVLEGVSDLGHALERLAARLTASPDGGLLEHEGKAGWEGDLDDLRRRDEKRD